MKTYYINNGNENGGPFTIEELRSQQISSATLVWYNGMDEWKYANDIDELKPLFNIVPPPITKIERPLSELPKSPNTIFGLKKSHFLVALLFISIAIFITVLNTIQSNKRSELEEQNRQTERNNVKVKLEQKVAAEQRIQAEIQNKIATANENKFKKDSINNRLSQVKELLVANTSKLENAKNDLIDAQKFKLLRSEQAKIEQISALQKDIARFKNEIDQLENESNRLYLTLETIH